MQIRIIGDIHGKYESSYFPLLNGCMKSLQIGDMGCDYKPLNDWGLDPNYDMFFGGNHDNYDIIKNCPNNIGSYGPIFGKAFFVRGAWSIDGNSRQRMMKDPICPKLWWQEEELDYKDLCEAKDDYIKAKPEIMFSHEAPYGILPYLNLNVAFAKSFGYESNNIATRTNLALDSMLQNHKPKMWFFGHYHKDFNRIIDGTHFICLTADVDYNYCKQRFFDIEV